MVDAPLTFGFSPSFGAAGGSGAMPVPPSTAGMHYAWGGPTNVGGTAYATGTPGIGNAGLRAYNPAISGPPAPFQAPTYSNSMSNWLGGHSASNADTAAAYGAMFGRGGGSASPAAGAGGSLFGGGGGGSGAYLASRAGGGGDMGFPAYQVAGPSQPPPSRSAQFLSNYTGRAPDPGAGSTPWDPNNEAYKMMYRNTINPDLGLNNLNRYNAAFQNFGDWGSPTAGKAMASVTGAESSGNMFAVNPSSGAFGGNQWMNAGPRDFRGTTSATMLGGFTSPEMQAANAAREIMGGGYNPTRAALNNPNMSLADQQRTAISNFEGLGAPKDRWQMNSDIKGAADWGTKIGSPLGQALATRSQFPGLWGSQ